MLHRVHVHDQSKRSILQQDAHRQHARERHRVPREALADHPPEQCQRVPRPRVAAQPGQHRVPRGHVPLGHFVEHPVGLGDAAEAEVGVDEGARGEDVGVEEPQAERAGVELRGGVRARGRADERREGEAVGAERVGAREEAAEEREREAREGGAGEGGDEGVGEEERGHLKARFQVPEVAGGDEDGVGAARERGRQHWWAPPRGKFPK
nr:unnamed protein product [Digitaria exilis]